MNHDDSNDIKKGYKNDSESSEALLFQTFQPPVGAVYKIGQMYNL